MKRFALVLALVIATAICLAQLHPFPGPGTSSSSDMAWDVSFYTSDTSRQLFVNAASPGNGDITRGTTSGVDAADFGLDGSGATFNGSQYGIQTANLGTGAQPTTVVALVKPTSLTETYAIYAYGTSGFVCDNSQKLRSLALATSNLIASGQCADLDAGKCCGLNEWYVLGYTFDGETATAYKNGVVMGSGAVTWNTVGTTGAVGHNAPGGGSDFNWIGSIARIRGWNKALTSGEMAQQFTSLRVWGATLPTPISLLGEDVSRTKSYTVSPAASPSFPDTGGVQLTNYRVREELWNGSDATVGWDSGTPTVVVDLGASQTISAARSYVGYQVSGGIYPPSQIVVSVSADNSTWTSVSTVNPPDGAEGYIKQTFDATAARYVKFEYTRRGGGSNWLMLGEVEVY